MVAIAVMLPQVAPGRESVLDRAGIVGFGVLVAWFLTRQASVSARPDAQGLTVRNLMVTRHLKWGEIVSVRFGQGRPWVQLDLADGDTLAVMGIQRADGVRADA
ncbi:MAG: PH domain-containing protein, partial [Cellulomonadaceae bacterium]|nr:PH domain-containing protein [Cellulomonadaceae bacterium]